MRIALWVVGLGAIVGLGIGLVLERREASRIADRSSELEHLSAELLRANRAKSEFLANVSHELRTPLNAIVGFVDLLRDGVYGALNSRQVGPVERIEASANHLRHLVDQVLDLAKMAAGRLEVHAEPLELRPFVFDVASEVEPLITEKGLGFSLAIGASLPSCPHRPDAPASDTHQPAGECSQVHEQRRNLDSRQADRNRRSSHGISACAGRRLP
jgi:signal transduction histidine kinase